MFPPQIYLEDESAIEVMNRYVVCLLQGAPHKE
jgi:hypothetical protein